MYRITKFKLRHPGDTSPERATIGLIDCTEKELNTILLPKLKQLASTDNLTYHLSGSDVKIKYSVTEIKGSSIDNLLANINNVITHNVSQYNERVNALNKTIKRMNKKNCVDSNKGVINNVKIKDYMKPFDIEVKFIVVDGVIIVSEDI